MLQLFEILIKFKKVAEYLKQDQNEVFDEKKLMTKNLMRLAGRMRWGRYVLYRLRGWHPCIACVRYLHQCALQMWTICPPSTIQLQFIIQLTGHPNRMFVCTVLCCMYVCIYICSVCIRSKHCTQLSVAAQTVEPCTAWCMIELDMFCSITHLCM